MRQETRPSRIISRQQLLVAAVTACFTIGAHALPTAPTVVNGVAGFAQSGNVLTVTNSAGAIINWQKFGIATGETARFIQPSASSAVLNQVVGVNGVREMSQIYGTLSSNGKVWLVNPAGILVGASGVIDTAGFIASTLTVRAEDFLAGKLSFQATPGAGNVVNRGTITTPTGGSVYLVGTHVSNEAGGVITTPGGETVLAAGATVDLIDTSTPGVKVEITGAANNATNLGRIVAEAGRIGIAGAIVRNSGTLDASSVVNEGGRIFLKASQDTYVDGAGRIVATGTKGGQVEVLGNRVAVMDQATIDVSGTNGGGTIKVGGDYQGKNPDIQNAQITFFGPEATLRANAINVGAGGTVIVWADDTTRAYGHIEARGGANGGNGGFVETSGKRYLDVYGIDVDTRAPLGTTGNWLLDPTDITIVYYLMPSPSSGIWTGSNDFSPGGSTSSIGWSTDLASKLNTTNVTINTSSTYGGNGDIIFGSGTFDLISSGNKLTLTADRDILVPNGTTINLGGNADMDMKASRDVSIKGNMTLDDLMIDAGRNVLIDTGVTVQTGTVADFFAGNNITINGVLQGEDISLNAVSSININSGSQVYASGGNASVFMASGFSKSQLYAMDSVTTYEQLNSYVANPSGQINIEGEVHGTQRVVMNTGSITLTGSGTVLADNSDIYAQASSNITLNNGTNMVAGQDVHLRLTGATSRLDINPTGDVDGAFIWAKASSTIFLTFTNLSSGGVWINGVPTLTSILSPLSGLFYSYPNQLVASPGFGLNLVYGITNNPVINTVTDTIIESTTSDPTIYDELPTVESIADSGFLTTDETIGGGDKEFGEDQTAEDPLNLRKKKYAQCKG